MTSPVRMTQTAPWPVHLDHLVSCLKYKAGWTITLEDRDRGQGSGGLTLCILIETPDSYAPARTMRVMHFMPVPPAAFDERSWRRWLFEQLLAVETHECMEFFEIDGAKPYAPSHAPGNDPYMVREIGSIDDQRTDFRGNPVER